MALNLTNATLANRCPISDPNTNATFADPGSDSLYDSPASSDRRCGYNGPVKIASLSRCCDGGSQIEISGVLGSSCGYLCPFNGTVADWKTCLNDDSLKVYCLKSTVVSGSSGSSGARRVRDSKRGSSVWTLVLVAFTILSMLMPAVSAAPSSTRSVLEVFRGPYVSFNNDDMPYFTQRVEVTNGSGAVVSQSVELPSRVLSSFPTSIGDLTLLFCSFFLAKNSTQLGYCGAAPLNIQTSYEVWAPNNTAVEFTLKPAYLCIEARVSGCPQGQTATGSYVGTYCISHNVVSKASLAVWSDAQTPLS
ncbi:hypothetical protein A4X09_0g6061 [Tilletia walkeri]|uniref:Uncharacterized protein n=1 Tax=Tilletia walkeri TaxID=117179 RepID=A0A8X7N5U2_9BASI|nr:hypothetical protein A4X09_0g6061 [Tilletia walkeri]